MVRHRIERMENIPGVHRKPIRRGLDVLTREECEALGGFRKSVDCQHPYTLVGGLPDEMDHDLFAQLRRQYQGPDCQIAHDDALQSRVRSIGSGEPRANPLQSLLCSRKTSRLFGTLRGIVPIPLQNSLPTIIQDTSVRIPYRGKCMPFCVVNRTSLTRILLPVLIVLTLSANMVYAQDVSTPVATDQLQPVLPEWQDELQMALGQASAAYTIDAEVRLPGGGTESPEIQGSMSISYTNTTGDPLETLPLRLYANGPDEQGDALQVDSIMVDGVATTVDESPDRSTVWVDLPSTLAPDQATTVSMRFVAIVPVEERDHYGIFNIDPERGTWALAHWYPILAGRDPERGWVLDPPSENGDPIFSTTASYTLTLRTPSEWRVVSTGVELDTIRTAEMTERLIVTGPARDLTLVLDDDFEKAEESVGGTTVTSWYNPGDERVGEAVLGYTLQSLSYFNDLIGPYPYTTLDVVPVELFGAAGVEFPQLLYIGASYYSPDQTLDVPNSLDFTVAHEVLHQWWYSMVGNNQYDDAFIDEGLTNFMSSMLYFSDVYGPEVGQAVTERYLLEPFRSNVTTGNDQIVDTPTDDFPNGGAYVFAAYSKAPLGFKAIYDEIGPEAFAEAVQQYYAEHRFTVATPEDLLAAFESASGRQLDELWNHWFEEAAGDEDI